MRLPSDPGFTTERAAFALRHTCEDCAFFDEHAQSCAHEWPTTTHRRAYYEAPPDAAPAPDIVLCKEFELR